ncbi:MAG: hypothetical protein QM650_17405 [Microlunatus sp.]
MNVEHPAITPRTIVEAFLPMDGAVGLDLLYDTANAAGLADQALRLCLRRMAAAGEIVQTGRGRRGSISPTDLGRTRLRRDRLALTLALAQDRGLAPWDQRWRLLAVSVPEAERPTRDLIRRTLVDAGAAPVSTGLFLSPHDLAAMLDDAQRIHLVQAAALDVDVRGETDPVALAEMLWPADEIIAGYGVLEETLSRDSLLDATDTEAVLVAQLVLAEELEQALRPDPLIPPELRAGPWPPTSIRQEWLRTWEALAQRLPTELLYRDWLTDGRVS